MAVERVNPESVLDAIDGGVVVLDQGGRVVRWNHWMEVASGLSQAGALGRTLPEVFPDADLRRLPAAVSEALSTNASAIITHALNPNLLPLRTRSGRPLFHDIAVTPVGAPP